MKIVKILTIALFLSLVSQSSNAQFWKDVLKTVTESGSSSSISSSSSSSKKKKKLSPAESSDESDSSVGIITSIVPDVIDHQTQSPALNLDVTVKYNQKKNGSIRCVIYADNNPLQIGSNYEDHKMLRDKLCYGEVKLPFTYFKESTEKKSIRVPLAADRLTGTSNETIYLKAYLIFDTYQKVMDIKDMRVSLSDVVELPSEESGKLGLISRVSVNGISVTDTRNLLVLDVKFWRRYMNTDFCCIAFVNNSPIPPVYSLEEMKPLLGSLCNGVKEVSGLKYSETEKCLVTVPIPKNFMQQPLYIRAYIVTAGNTTELRRQVYKTHVAYIGDMLAIDPTKINISRGVDVNPELVKFGMQVAYSNLFGVDGNGNQVCNKCDGSGCADCNWRGWKNDILTSALKTMGSSKGSNTKTINSSRVSTPLNGRHTKVFQNGDKYVGDFKNGYCTGKGTYTWVSEGLTYTGDFNYNQLHGFGTFTDKTMKYVGEFKNDKMDGKGILYDLENKEYVKGLWKDEVLIEVYETGPYSPQSQKTVAPKK
jgi:hypothetical protein